MESDSVNNSKSSNMVEAPGSAENAAIITQLRKELSALQNKLDLLEKVQDMSGNRDEGKNIKNITEPGGLPRTSNPPFILEKDTSFEVWKRIVMDEFKSFGFQYLLEGKETPTNVEKCEAERRVGFANSYLFSRVCSDYKMMVCNLEHPLDILDKLQKIRCPIMLSTRFAIRRAWSSLTFSKSKETASEFINRFEELTRKLERQGETVAENDLKENFLMATEASFPEITRKYDAAKGEITIDEIKQLLLNEEARELEMKERASEGEAMKIEPMENKKKTTATNSGENRHQRGRHHTQGKVCRRCGKSNHLSFECRSPLRICYNCKELTSNHTAETCFKPTVYGRNRVGYRYNRRVAIRRGRLAGTSRRGLRRGASLFRRVKIVSDNKDQPAKYVFLALDGPEEVGYATTDPETEVLEAQVVDGNINNKNNIICFITDTGATEHLVKEGECLINKEDPKGMRIRSANKNSTADLPIEYKGSVVTEMENGCEIKLENVLYTKHLTRNLFSVRKLISKGIRATFDDEGVELRNKQTGKLIKSGKYDGKFWWLEFEYKNKEELRTKEKETKRQEGAKYGKLKGIKRNIQNGGSKAKDGESLIGAKRQKHESEPVPGCSKDTTEPQPGCSNNDLEDHTYTNILTYKNVNSENTLRKYIETVSEMRLSDLKEIDSRKVTSLRDNIGLLWHYRLGHVSKSYLEKASKIVPELKGVKFSNVIIDCEACKLAKISREPCNTVRYNYKEPMKLIHTDVMGPIAPCTYIYGARYIITFLDDCTRYAWAYPLQDKTMIHIAFGKMLEDARSIRGNDTKITFLRLDNGREYMTEAMKRIIEKEQIKLENTPADTPSLNGAAERLNRDIQEKIRALIFSSGFPKQLWAYALQYAIQVYNKTPKSRINFKTPYELFHERPCTVKYFRRFGCLSYVLITKSKAGEKESPKGKHKFDEKGNIGFLVAMGKQFYYIIEPHTGKVYKSKHVSFVESKNR